MDGVELSCLRVLDGAVSYGDHGLFGPIWHGLDPCQVAVNLVKDHLVLVALDGVLGELASFISEQCPFDIVDFHNDVLLL